MRIVNNKIYIIKGETPTYSAQVIDRDSGAPFIIDEQTKPTNNDKVYVQFIVREGVYYRDDDFVLKCDLDVNNVHVFKDSTIKPYNGEGGLGGDQGEWSDSITPSEEDMNRLFRRTNNLDENFYAYYSDGHWTPYSFDINIPFLYRETSVMEPKTYKYEISLLRGKPKENPTSEETPIDIEYKKPLLPLTDFIVEGSISE